MVVVGAGSFLHLHVGEPLARTVLAPWWITHSAVKMECRPHKEGATTLLLPFPVVHPNLRSV